MNMDNKLKKVNTKGIFFTLIKPCLSMIDNGDLFRKPISWFYMLLAVINLMLPIYIFSIALDNHIFDLKAKHAFVFLLIWIVIAFISWISFQLWWDRKSKVICSSTEGDKFVATPVFAHFIQTLGEWLGIWIGIGGTAFTLFTKLFLGDDARYLTRMFKLDFLDGPALFIVMPICGFLIIIITKFMAEQFMALSVIANNTKKE